MGCDEDKPEPPLVEPELVRAMVREVERLKERTKRLEERLDLLERHIIKTAAPEP